MLQKTEPFLRLKDIVLINNPKIRKNHLNLVFNETVWIDFSKLYTILLVL